MFSYIFEYQFLTNAIIAIALTSILCGITGTYIVTNRMVFLSGGITHASFGGLGMACFLGINPIIGAIIFSILAALCIELFTSREIVRQDSMIGILWALGMSIGIIFMALTPGYSPNLMSYMFGSVLSIEKVDIIMSAILTTLTVLLFAFFIRPIQFISFDSEYIKSCGVKIYIFKYILIALVALTIVFSIKIAGIVLVISLLTIPQAVTNMFTANYVRIIYFSIIISLICSFAGLAGAWYINIPSGASIIIALTSLFVLAKLFLYIRKRILHKL